MQKKHVVPLAESTCFYIVFIKSSRSRFCLSVSVPPCWKEFCCSFFGHLRVLILREKLRQCYTKCPCILPLRLEVLEHCSCWTYLLLWNERGLLLLPDGNLSSHAPPSTVLCVSAHPYHHLPICIYSNSQNGGIIVTISRHDISPKRAYTLIVW